MGEFKMPSLGADMEAGTLVQWLKHPGDSVRHGDIIAVVETQKGAIEVEVFEDGRIEKLLVGEGATVPVGTPLALIAGAAEAPGQVIPPVAPAVPAPPKVPLAEPIPSRVVPPSRGDRHVSPAARKLAAERDVDVTALKGSGPEGAIVREDVLRAVAAPAKPRAPQDLSEMRKAIAAAMARSKREIPHYYLGHDIDLSTAHDFVSKVNADRPPDRRLLPAVLLLKATALALREHRRFNGFYMPEGFVPSDRVHIGNAVAIRGGGLIAPAIHDADRKTLDELMGALRDLVARVRAGRLRSSELTDPTVTISSLGERGVTMLFGVIQPPQVALIGFGTPAERPWAVDGALAVRRVVTATLAADHRVTDGHQGALLLASIAQHLGEPDTL